jgi:catechol 2,3-dioxygenase-like lactoylglutathione lyase family enzyme
MSIEPGRLNSACPIMPTTDVARSVDFYKALGFAVEVHDGFIMTRRDDTELFLSLNPDHDPRTTASCIFMRVDDADALHARWTAQAAPGLHELRDTDYGMRQFAVIDPDGNMMLCASPLRR